MPDRPTRPTKAAGIAATALAVKPGTAKFARGSTHAINGGQSEKKH
eukprot:CAMPEP_0197599618 /NCGR_PEP_ID=MMETSP1326-20131121/31717_1 /TAXON_ID=1155430 /ORGANISM="Genus nov. species nov., Strain RCC2288" /LENGTH=45 /DNA_ID= /DNA_START= /DNA_END= /DNA_ORIENTATION=